MRSAVIIVAMCMSLGWIVPGPTLKEIDMANEHIRRIFPEAMNIDRHSFHLSPADNDSVTKLSTLQWTGSDVDVWIPSANDLPLAYAVIDHAKGKDQLITYLVIVSPKLVVKNVEILTYRESYGGEVRNSSWLRQFVDKQANNDLRPGRDIRNITGATISARSMTLGVKKVLCLLRILKERLPRLAGTKH